MIAKRLYSSVFVTTVVSAFLTAAGSFTAMGSAEEQQKSLQELQSLAERGDASAQLRLAKMFEQGDGVPKDDYQAWHWAQAVMLGAEYDREAQKTEVYRQAEEIFLRAGEHVTPEQFLEGLKKAEEASLAVARKNYADGLQRYQAAAEAGDSEAQFQLGEMYRDGFDYAKSVDWYRKAAEQGNGRAQYMLGYTYYEGSPEVSRDYEQAYYWLLRSVDGEDAQLRTMLDEAATHVPQERRMAIKQEILHRVHQAVDELKRRAEHGDANAQFELAQDYEIGRRVPANPSEAYRWYRRAADQGDTRAYAPVATYYMTCGGYVYQCEDIKQRDPVEAARWYVRSAEAGYPHIQSYLGEILAKGYMVPRDNERAYFWLSVAKAQGNNERETLRADIAAKLPPGRAVGIEGAAAAWKQGLEVPARYQGADFSPFVVDTDVARIEQAILLAAPPELFVQYVDADQREITMRGIMRVVDGQEQARLERFAQAIRAVEGVTKVQVFPLSSEVIDGTKQVVHFKLMVLCGAGQRGAELTPHGASFRIIHSFAAHRHQGVQHG